MYLFLLCPNVCIAPWHSFSLNALLMFVRWFFIKYSHKIEIFTRIIRFILQLSLSQNMWLERMDLDKIPTETCSMRARMEENSLMVSICAMNLVYICDCKAFWSTYDTVICEIKAISNSHTSIKNWNDLRKMRFHFRLFSAAAFDTRKKKSYNLARLQNN